MCGIGGLWRPNEEAAPIVGSQLTELLLVLEARGNDASGIAAITDGKLHILKSSSAPSHFVLSKEYRKFCGAYVEEQPCTHVMVHARFATSTFSPMVMENNHPVTAGLTAVCHNGEFNNADGLFHSLQLTRKAPVDTDLVRAFFDARGITKESTERLGELANGSCAMTVFRSDDPKHFLIARSGSPLMVGTSRGQMLWASTRKALHNAARRWQLSPLGFWVQDARSDLCEVHMPVDTAWYLGPEGIEWHAQFKTCMTYKRPDYTRVYREYNKRQEKWRKGNNGVVNSVCEL